MKRITLVLLLLGLPGVDLYAQTPTTFHVFPQIADGLLADGSSYFSSIVVVNTGTRAATCTIRLYGAVASHISGSLVLTISASGGVANKNTSLTDARFLPLATGYGTLTCDQPVAAQVGYFFLGANLAAFNVIGGATVFSSPPSMRSELFVTNASGFRSAMAIANDTDAAATYQLNVISDTGQPVVSANVSVPARSNVAKFIDELVQLPPNFGGGAILNSTTTPFSAVGLLFNGSTFVSVAAVPF